MATAKSTAVLRPFMRPKDLTRALGLPKGSESQLLRRIGWSKHRGLFSLRVDRGDKTNGGGGTLAALLPPRAFAMRPGTYHARAPSQCLVPLGASLALAEELGISVQVMDPEPPPPPRSPPPAASGTGVVAVLAHVDHGKTTLLDALLGSDFAAREAGGITQCVRPSLLPLAPRTSSANKVGATAAAASSAPPLHTLAFVDTPGHQVFAGMRAVASDGADLALVLVAVDAGIQLQTREVVRRCARLGQPVQFALTKADTAGRGHAEAARSRRVRLLRAALRRLWTAEQRRASRVDERRGARAQDNSKSRREGRGLGGRADRPPRARAAEAPVPLLCAPRGWGLDALVCTLRRRLSAISAPTSTPISGLIISDELGRLSREPTAEGDVSGDDGGGSGGSGGSGGGGSGTASGLLVARRPPAADEAAALVLESSRSARAEIASDCF